MHIPSEMLQGGICPVTAGIATAGVAASAWLLYKGKAKVPAAGKFAMVSAAASNCVCLLFVCIRLSFQILLSLSYHALVIKFSVNSPPFVNNCNK